MIGTDPNHGLHANMSIIHLHGLNEDPKDLKVTVKLDKNNIFDLLTSVVYNLDCLGCTDNNMVIFELELKVMLSVLWLVCESRRD